MYKSIVDLTHTLHESVPTWDGSCGFGSTIELEYDQGCCVQTMKLHAGVGTHIDAPAHFIPGGSSVSELQLEKLIAPLYIIDGRAEVCATSVDYQLQVRDIHCFEYTHGPINAGSFVAVLTGWSAYWHDTEMYRNVDLQGAMHFPSISTEAAAYLIKKNVVGIGIDTLSPDCSQTYFPVHEQVLGSGKYIVENIAHLDKLDPIGWVACILPLKARGMVEMPVRMIAWKQ